MKIQIPSSDNVKASAMIAGVVVAGYLAWRLYRGGVAAAEIAEKVVTEKLNPTSDHNIAYQGANNILQTLTGDPRATLGTKLYDWTH